MSYRRAFKPSLVKRIFAWVIIVLFGLPLLGALGGAGWQVLSGRQDALAALLVSSAILLLIVMGGVAILRTYFVLADDAIEIVRLWGTRIHRVDELGGYDYFTLVINGVPMRHIRLYRFGLKEAGMLPINKRDRGELETWFAERLPAVIRDGSNALARPRYADEAGLQRDPELRNLSRAP